MSQQHDEKDPAPDEAAAAGAPGETAAPGEPRSDGAAVHAPPPGVSAAGGAGAAAAPAEAADAAPGEGDRRDEAEPVADHAPPEPADDELEAAPADEPAETPAGEIAYAAAPVEEADAETAYAAAPAEAPDAESAYAAEHAEEAAAESAYAAEHADETAAGAPRVDGDADDEDESTEEAAGGAAALAQAELRSVLESLLLAADRPLSIDRLRELCAMSAAEPLRQALTALQREYLDGGRGFQLHEVAGGFQLRTAPQNALFVQRLLQQKPVRLSRAQLETLAIVAYRQPITRPEIDDIRGVDSGGTLKVLLERTLLRVLGKKEEPGRPLLYGTTREFLEFFNLRDLRDLPTLREFYELSEEHQAQVNAIGGPLEEAEKRRPEPEPPPPLTRVELKDLQLGDDEEELSRIDGMIQEVRTDFQLDAVLAQAEIVAGAPPKPPAPAPAAGDSDDREPEEL